MALMMAPRDMNSEGLKSSGVHFFVASRGVLLQRERERKDFSAACLMPHCVLCASVMWPIVVSLALNCVAEYHRPFAGILFSGII